MCVNSHHLQDDQHLYQVEPALAEFVFSYKGWRLAETICKFGLRQACILSCAHQHKQASAICICMDGSGQSPAFFLDRASYSRYRITPKTGVIPV